MNQRTYAILSVAIASVPLWILGDLYLLVFRARVFLDRWPLPCNPDPKDLPFEFHYLRICLSLHGVLLWLLFSAGLLLFIKYSGGKLTPGLLLAVVGWGFFFAIFNLDPGDYVAWFFD